MLIDKMKCKKTDFVYERWIFLLWRRYEIIIYGEKLKNKIIQSDEFIVKESQHKNVSVLMR